MARSQSPGSAPATGIERTVQSRTGDRVAIRGTIQNLAARDDRIFMTIGLQGAPAPIVLDTIWSNCAACDLSVGSDVRLDGWLERIDDQNGVLGDLASVTLDGLSHEVVVPVSEIVTLWSGKRHPK